MFWAELKSKCTYTVRHALEPGDIWSRAKTSLAKLINGEKTHEQAKTTQAKDSESAAKRQNDNQEEKTKPSKDDKHTHFHSH